MDYLHEKLKFMLNSEKIRLPYEYEEVEYIQSTGTQYINTKIKTTMKDRYELGLYAEK